MKELRLAVISDIHAGKAARAKDLCPPQVEGWKNKPDDKYRDKFLAFIKKNDLKADYLVLPGDVTDGAKPEEVKIASEFIADAAAALAVPLENIVFVPGNHDVDWEVLKIPDSTGVRHAQRYDPIRFKDFHFKAIVERGKGGLFESPHFTVWQFKELVVVGYNSSHHDQPEMQHYGLIDQNHIMEMRNELERLAMSDDQLRVFLVHHHSYQYDDPTTPDRPDPSIMVNAEKLQAVLRDYKFDLLIHGHKHLPRFKTDSLDGLPEIAVLCSGSFSIQIDTKWSGSISNQFHLITVEGRDPEEHLIVGKVVSWSYNCARGWAPSNAVYDGMPYVEPFGTYTRVENLKNLLQPILRAQFEKDHFIEWNWVLNQQPRLRHLRPEVVIRVLDELAVTCSFKRIHDSPEKMILLKNK